MNKSQRIIELLMTEVVSEVGHDVKKFMNDMEKSIQKLFPKSHVSVGVLKVLGDAQINVDFLLGNNKQEYPNGISRNDLAIQRITIESDGFTGENLPERMIADLILGGNIHEPNYNNVEKVGWRKKTGSPEQIADHIEKYFKKVRKLYEKKKDTFPANLQDK